MGKSQWWNREKNVKVKVKKGEYLHLTVSGERKAKRAIEMGWVLLSKKGDKYLLRKWFDDE